MKIFRSMSQYSTATSKYIVLSLVLEVTAVTSGTPMMEPWVCNTSPGYVKASSRLVVVSGAVNHMSIQIVKFRNYFDLCSFRFLFHLLEADREMKGHL